MTDGYYIERNNYGYKWVIVSTIMAIKIARSSPFWPSSFKETKC